MPICRITHAGFLFRKLRHAHTLAAFKLSRPTFHGGERHKDLLVAVVLIVVAAAAAAAAAAASAAAAAAADADADADADAAAAIATSHLVAKEAENQIVVVGKSNRISAIAEPASMLKVFIACQEASSGRRTRTLSLTWRYQRKRV